MSFFYLEWDACLQLFVQMDCSTPWHVEKGDVIALAQLDMVYDQDGENDRAMLKDWMKKHPVLESATQ